jgi:hypothetical protein
MAYRTVARNVRYVTPGSSYSGYPAVFILREIYLLCDWQEMENDGHAAWTSANNVFATPTDLAVSDTEDFVITSASNPFTEAMEGGMVSLMSANDNNRGLYEIIKVASAGRMIVHSMCRIGSWTTETGITGKIHNGGIVDYLASSSYFVMRAPAATGRPLEVKIMRGSGSASYIDLWAYPLGDWFDPPGTPSTPGARTATAKATAVCHGQSVADRYAYFNAYQTDPAGDGLLLHVLMASVNAGGVGRFSRVVAGELEGVHTGDDYPGFVNGSGNSETYENPDYEIESDVFMLDDVNAPITGWPTYWCAGTGYADPHSENPGARPNSAYAQGKAIYWKPPVIMDGGNGGYVRGVLPYYACNDYLPMLFPLDTDYMHVRKGNVIPRISSEDKSLKVAVNETV